MVDSRRRLPSSVAYLTSLGGIVVLLLLRFLGLYIEVSPFSVSWQAEEGLFSILMGGASVLLLSLLLRRQAEFYMLLRSQQKGLLFTTLGLCSLALGFTDASSLLLLLGMIGIQYLLLATYQQEHASLATFPMGVIVGIMMLYHPALLLLLPILIYLFYPLRAFSLRNTLGLLLGTFVVPWLLIPASLLLPEWGLWEHCVARWGELTLFSQNFVFGRGGWQLYLPWIVMGVQWVVSSLALTDYYAQESVRGRDSGSMLAQLSLLLLAASCIGPVEQGLMFVKLALIPLSVRAAILFTLCELRPNRIILTTYTILLVILSLLH